MTIKLTLAMDKKTIEAAKEYAKKNNISLSGIVELYFKTLSSSTRNNRIGPITRELSGIANFKTAKTDKELLKDALIKRYL